MQYIYIFNEELYDSHILYGPLGRKALLAIEFYCKTILFIYCERIYLLYGLGINCLF